MGDTSLAIPFPLVTCPSVVRGKVMQDTDWGRVVQGIDWGKLHVVVVEDIVVGDINLADLDKATAFDPLGIPALVVDRRVVDLSSLAAVRTFF